MPLHVVAHLVSDDVGIGKVAVGPQLLFHLSKERQVDVEFLVARAIEGSHLCRALSAGRLRAVGVEHHGGHLVLHVVVFENLLPHILRAGQYLRGKARQFLFLLGELALLGADLGIGARQRAQSAILLEGLYARRQRVAAREVGNGHGNDDTHDAGTHASLLAATHAAAVFHVGTFSSSV